jgi:hypothetical protein
VAAEVGERLTGDQDPLGPSDACPRIGRCQACGTARGRAAATYQTPVGVFCATVCDWCVAAGNPPPVRSWAGAVERVLAHCQHFDLDIEEMGALLCGECGGGGDGWG